MNWNEIVWTVLRARVWHGPHRYPGDPHLCPIWEARKRPPGVGAGIWCGCMAWHGIAWYGCEENPWGPIVHLAATEACRAVSQSTTSFLVSTQIPKNWVTPAPYQWFPYKNYILQTGYCVSYGFTKAFVNCHQLGQYCLWQAPKTSILLSPSPRGSKSASTSPRGQGWREAQGGGCRWWSMTTEQWLDQWKMTNTHTKTNTKTGSHEDVRRKLQKSGVWKLENFPFSHHHNFLPLPWDQEDLNVFLVWCWYVSHQGKQAFLIL